MIVIFLADGFEEIEAVVPWDIIRRAGGEVKFAGETEFVTGSLGLKIFVDIRIEDIDTTDLQAIILPGGMPGTKNLDDDKKVHEIINYCAKNGILICAICAAPIIIGKMGLLQNKNACCYPGCEKYLLGAKISKENVCSDGNFITARGPGAAFEFGFEIVKKFKETEIKRIKKEIQI
ncbi:MAG: DJ-1/PfpI family protein [Candidatus Improbicoccus pseudotrichonymphae]|uniref:DJ-1/PfpI family protein n=1 Tax=Candidatus Improbicoccus pseudotrichonymphae TaxID=3033792 RepID=A0AA48HUT0_9FIRM|nr:MAG: DJ-1/PfpI family protein [Candidatus Improbicoccus pseudotrichonymphae]